VLWHDGQGMCLFAKRLERGRFVWPSPVDGTVAISPAQLGYLLEGIDWRHPQRTWRPEAADRSQRPCRVRQLMRARERCDSIISETTADSLPDDVATLKALVLAGQAALTEATTAQLATSASMTCVIKIVESGPPSRRSQHIERSSK
jgi:hypothetical protein